MGLRDQSKSSFLADGSAYLQRLHRFEVLIDNNFENIIDNLYR